ncbi:collagen alpha-1(I) chain-like [Lacerta agilis]|uniref:collagen alpha-1(I) chain-like n=1 Tax=Lacerta agilis TaxID=80427 RepID=UPI001419C1D9|nr:collagen alpha-1(I) chain-like [Lacerta agilis]
MGSRPLQILVSGSEESGKSTLVGHLLYKCGHLSPETMKTLRKQKVEQGMSYRQLLQSLQVEERHATPWRRHYRSPKYEVIIIATPPCLSLLARRKVDCMLFVVSAAKREFETGWSLTQKQIVSACKLPVKLLVVCVNKMDSSTPAPYNYRRYKAIVGKVFNWFWAWEREPRTVLFLPISALYGDNLQETSVKMLWFCKWEIARERGGVVTGTTLQQLLDAIPICHHRPDLPFAPLGWTKKEEEALLRTWRILSPQAPDHIPSPSMMSTALRQAGVWRSAEQCRSKVDALLRCYMADVLRGGIGCFPFYWELHDILGYDVSTAAFQLRQFKQELVPTANATTAPDLGWAEDVFVLLGPSGQGALAFPKEGEKEEELAIPGPSGQEEPVAPEEAELVRSGHFDQGEAVVPEEGEEAELVLPGHFGQGEPVVPEEGEEAELVHPQHFGQGELLVLEEGEEAELVHLQHFGQGEPVVPEEGEEAELVLPGHFGQGEPVVPEEGEEAQLVHPQHFGQGEPVVPEEREEAELVLPGHFGQGELLVLEEGEEAELVHLQHFGQGEPVVPEEGEEAEHVHLQHFGQGEPVVPEEREEAEHVHLQHFGQGEPVVPEEGEEAELVLPGHFGQGDPVVLEEGEEAEHVHPGPSGQGPDPYSETKSTSKPRALDIPDYAESPLGPRPPKSPRGHPPSGRLGRSSGYKLCPGPPRPTRYELPPQFSRSFKHDPDPGPSTSSSRQDPCPGTSRNSRPDSHPGPSTSGSRFELHPRPSGSSGHNLPGAGLERRPGSPMPLIPPAARSDTGVSPEEEEEDTCSTGVPTQPPSAMASWENLIGPPLFQYPTPGPPMLLPSPFPFPHPLPPAQIQQEPPFPLPEPVYQLPLLGEASWAPASATLPPPLHSPPASFPLQDPPTQLAQPPPYSPPFQQPPAQAIPFFSQPFVPPGSFRAPTGPQGNFVFPPPPGPQGNFVFPPPPGPEGHFVFPPPPGPEGHFVFPPPATQAFPNPSPQTPDYAQDFPRAFGRSGPFSLYSFPWHGTSAYPLGIKITLEPTSWPRRFWEWKPLPLPQPSKPESLLPQPPPVTAPPLPPRPPSLAGPDPDGVEALSSAASLAPKPTPQPGSPSSSPPKALPQTPRQPPPLGTGPLPPLISCMAPSGTGDQATRLPPPTLPAASPLPSGSPPQLPGPPSQPGSPGLQTSQRPSDSPPRLLKAPPPLIPILPPLSPSPLPSVPGAPDPLGNSPPPLAATPHPHGAPRPATASLQQSLVHVSPPGHSPLSPPKPHSPSANSPSSSL